MKNVVASSVVSAAGLALACPVAHADITGFDPSSFAYNQTDAHSPATVGPGSINFSNRAAFEYRSLWYNERQPITSFTCTFTYRLADWFAGGANQGIAFVVQNSAAGTGWVSPGANPANVGYAGLDHSAAVTLEFNTGSGLTYSGFYTNGATGGGSPATLPVNAFSMEPINVAIAYSGSLLTVNMTQGTRVMPTQTYLVGSLASQLGADSGWVGFVTGNGGGAQNVLSDFHFTAIPAPGAMGLAGVAGLAAVRRRR